MGKKVKVNIVLSEEVLNSIDNHASRLGMNRSAYIAMMEIEVMKSEERRRNMMPSGCGYSEEY